MVFFTDLRMTDAYGPLNSEDWRSRPVNYDLLELDKDWFQLTKPHLKDNRFLLTHL